MSHPCPPEDDYPPIRALNDLLYCERRCALHRIENVWVDNAHTVSGTFAHQRADKPVDWKCGDGREVHGMWLKSDRLRLVGKADVVEFTAALRRKTEEAARRLHELLEEMNPSEDSLRFYFLGEDPSRFAGFVTCCVVRSF